ncbi:hypothetical protein TRIP_B50354 [uncultured Desulfatiglans sp.]|nr:hypothetical protein TRIP_B50354 [uncultured Desulfatiglans sp.]
MPVMNAIYPTLEWIDGIRPAGVVFGGQAGLERRALFPAS